MPQASAGICFCRMPSDGNTVKCGNPQCPFVEFHLSCLAISTPLPKGWYCPHWCRLPQFKRLRKVKKNSSENNGPGFISWQCLYLPSSATTIWQLLECHSKDCQSGKFYHLTFLGYKKMPNNSKTTWKCTNWKKSNAKPFHDKSAVPVSTGQENAVTTTTLSSQSHGSEPEFIELDMYSVQDSDSEGESADDTELTMVTTCESERHRSLRNLDVQDYQLIMSPHGWLDCVIVHSAQVLLQKINPLIEGFQRPTLGPVRNFSVVSDEFVQLLHTGQDHWVCVISRMSPWNSKTFL